MFHTLLKRNKRYHELYRGLCTFLYFSRLFSWKKINKNKLRQPNRHFDRLNVANLPTLLDGRVILLEFNGKTPELC